MSRRGHRSGVQFPQVPHAVANRYKNELSTALGLLDRAFSISRVHFLCADRGDGRGALRSADGEELIPLAEKLLEVPQQLIRTALDLELQEGTVIADQVGETPCVFLAGLHRAERTIADRLTRLANGTLPWPWIDPDSRQAHDRGDRLGGQDDPPAAGGRPQRWGL